MPKKSVTRLFEQFKPKHYDLNLQLLPDTMSFKGSIVIHGAKTGKPSQRLTFHQKGLKVNAATVRREDKKAEKIYTVDRINNQDSYDEVRLHTSEMMYPGDYVIMVDFEGKITENMEGIYPCFFTLKGKKKFLLATQFESHHAREAFPCIDEPEAKATFSLVLKTPDEGEVIANTPAIRTDSDGKGLRITEFEETPIMSTYLLAFAFGDVGFKEAKTKNGTLVRTYATPDNVQHTEFALDVAVKCLDFYEDYFAIPFPLPKIDMIALPDFASGAMENWGLITYRESCMLFDPKNTSLGVKQYVAMVVAHELAHQWFGNLVTMQWWTDLWLNEGFASWVEYLAMDELFPDWEMWTQFAADEQQSALKLDALDNTHPIEVPINHPDEIRSIFDTISYKKGSSVIHMLYGYLGPEDFRDGLRHYLKKHAYGNTVTEDLWAALEEASKKPVREFMHAWTSMPGFPLLTVKKTPTTTEVEQRRFYAIKPAKSVPQTWPIPLLTHSEAPASLETPSAVIQTANFAKFNQGQSGFYRTLYDPKALKLIAAYVPEMSPLDRMGLLADSFETAKAGYSHTGDALELLVSYKDEDNASVWEIIAGNLGEIRRVMDDDTVREDIKPVIRKLVAKQIKRLGWEEKPADSHFDKLLRPTVLSMASSADDPEVVKECLDRFEKAKKPEDIEADFRGMVYVTAARHGDVKTYDKLWDFHQMTDSSEERVTIALAMTSFEQPALYKKALSLVTTDDVRKQDAMYWVAYSFGNRHAKKATWEWLQKNWDWLVKNLGTDLSFSRTPMYVARSFSDEAILKEYNAFFEPKMSPLLERAIKQGVEVLESQIAWKQRDLASIQEFLRKA